MEIARGAGVRVIAAVTEQTPGTGEMKKKN